MAEVEALKEDFLHCSICTNRLKVPKVLPCIHTFCEECLENYVKELGSKQLPCPICRKVCDLSKIGVKGLKTNFYIVNLCERMDLLERLDESVSHAFTCESCESQKTSQKVTAYCLECDSKICPKCQKDHKRFPVLRSHSIIPIKEIKEPKYQKELQNAKSPLCEVHPSESLRFYCKTCSKLICRDCTIVQHSKPDHTFIEASCQVEDIKQDLRKLLSESSADLTKGLEFIKKGEAGLEAVERESESIIRNINASCDKMVGSIKKQLSSQAKEMVTEVRDSKTSQMKMIDEKVKMAATWVTRMENTQEVTEKILNENNIWEILSMSDDIIGAFRALNIDSGDFNWVQSDLKQSMAFSSYQPPSAILGTLGGDYDVILSDQRGNFFAVKYDCVSSNLWVKKIRQDKAYNADTIASLKMAFKVPKNLKVIAVLERNAKNIFIGLGRCVVQLQLPYNSKVKIMEVSKDKDALIDFMTVWDNNAVLFFQLRNYSNVKQLYYSELGWQSVNQIRSHDATSSVSNTQHTIPFDHLPIENITFYGNTLIYSKAEEKHGKANIFMLSQNISYPLKINSIDKLRDRQLLRVIQGTDQGRNCNVIPQRKFGQTSTLCVSFTCYMVWSTASSSLSRSDHTFIVTEYQSDSQDFIHTWKVPDKTSQPVACYKNTGSNQLVVSDKYGKVTTCTPLSSTPTPNDFYSPPSSALTPNDSYSSKSWLF